MSPSTPESCPLTKRQLEILTLTAEGLSGKQIAHRLGISHSTERNHLHGAYQLLNVAGAPQAIIACARAGWIDFGGEGSNEAGQIFKLEKLLTRIAVAIEKRRERRLTLIQRQYLDAFEAHLYANTPTDIRVTADRMLVRFAELAAEAGISIEPRHTPRYRRTARKAA